MCGIMCNTRVDCNIFRMEDQTCIFGQTSWSPEVSSSGLDVYIERNRKSKLYFQNINFLFFQLQAVLSLSKDAKMSGTFTKKVVTSCMKRPRPGRLPGPCARLTPPLTPPGTWPRSQPMINSCSWSASFKPVTEFWLGGKKCRGSHPGSGLMEAPGTMTTGRQCSQATLVLGKDDMRVQSTYKLAEQKFGSPLSFHLL